MAASVARAGYISDNEMPFLTEWHQSHRSFTKERRSALISYFFFFFLTFFFQGFFRFLFDCLFGISPLSHKLLLEFSSA